MHLKYSYVLKPRPHDQSGIKVTIKLRTKYQQTGKNESVQTIKGATNYLQNAIKV